MNIMWTTHQLSDEINFGESSMRKGNDTAAIIYSHNTVKLHIKLTV